MRTAVPTGHDRPDRGRRRPLALAGLVLAGATVVSACGSGGPHTAAPPPSSTLTQATTPYYDPGHLVPAPVGSTTVPRESPGQAVTPDIGAGQQIIITAHGFEPAQLYAVFTVPVTWTNLSGVAQQVVFDYFPIRSKVIAAGAQFVWSSRGGGSFTYHSASGFHALLVMQPSTK